jgi:HD-like signal output (HDOD) protein
MGFLSLFKRRGQTADQLLDESLGDFTVPTFNPRSIQLLRLLRNPDTPTKELSRAIEASPGLLVRVLRTVNSASFGMRRRIGSAQQATVLMGRSDLESLVVGLCVRQNIPAQNAPGYDAPRFWIAASRRASLARGIASHLHPESQAECFTAGLLQDMAVPLLANAQPTRYGPLLTHWHESPQSSLDDLEQAEFGWNHGAIGASMAERWGLPDFLSTGIDNHHLGECDVTPPAIRLVGHVREVNGDGLDQLIERCRDEYNLAPDRMVEVIEHAEASAQELASALS